MKKIFWAIGAMASILIVYFIFIPAFAGRLALDPVLHIGPAAIRWYGIILALGILASYAIVRKNSWKFGISKTDVDDFSFWLVIVSILGARIYYVLFSWEYYLSQPAEIYKVWHGGLSIYGAVIAGIVFSYFYCRNKAYSFWRLADLMVLGLPLGQAIGRLGNFVNQEAFGRPTTLPWKMFVAPDYRPPQLINYEYFHPAFLYEAMGSLIIFFILYRLIGKLKSGGLFLIYLFSYSLVRFFVEGIRIDSFIIGGFRGDQLVAFILVILSGIWFYKRQSK